MKNKAKNRSRTNRQRNKHPIVENQQIPRLYTIQSYAVKGDFQLT